MIWHQVDGGDVQCTWMKYYEEIEDVLCRAVKFRTIYVDGAKSLAKKVIELHRLLGEVPNALEYFV